MRAKSGAALRAGLGQGQARGVCHWVLETLELENTFFGENFGPVIRSRRRGQKSPFLGDRLQSIGLWNMRRR